MQNFVVNTFRLYFRNKSVSIVRKNYGTSKTVEQRCAGGICDGKSQKPEKKCSTPPPPPEKPKPQLKKAAVVLSGCGHLDGTCIYEAASVAINLSKYGIMPCFYAPKGPQCDVYNHQTGTKTNEERIATREAARLARGKIQDICELRHCDASCVIFPGGFGVTKTLTTFEQDKACCNIDVEVMRVLEEFHDARKPMGFICIAAILPARMFPLVKVTFGMKGKPDLWPYQYVIDIACEMGAEVETRNVDGFSFDKQHMVFSTPAFMYNGNFSQVFDGISNMVQNMCKYIE